MNIDTQAITQALVTIVTAVIAICVAVGLNISQQTTNEIIQAVTVITPVLLGLIGWLSHNRAQVKKAAILALGPTATQAALHDLMRM